MHGVKHNLNHISMTHVHELVGALFLFVLYLGSCTKNTTIKIDELYIYISIIHYILYIYIICILYIIYNILYIYNWDHTMQS